MQELLVFSACHLISVSLFFNFILGFRFSFIRSGVCLLGRSGAETQSVFSHLIEVSLEKNYLWVSAYHDPCYPILFFFSNLIRDAYFDLSVPISVFIHFSIPDKWAPRKLARRIPILKVWSGFVEKYQGFCGGEGRADLSYTLSSTGYQGNTLS